MSGFYRKKTLLITGSAGFIGFHISKKMLEAGWNVLGVDSLNDYYSVALKKEREKILLNYNNYTSVRAKVEDKDVLLKLFEAKKPDLVIHLAAQAGVRPSIEFPRTYLESNVNGTFELLEAARKYPPSHILIASTSSVYGANESMPYKETDKADNQMSFYAATKKATENIAHSYAHLFSIPITMFRFFPVYGPFGREEMALFKFTKAILNEEVIDVYNNGKMQRDFTFIDDLCEAVQLLCKEIPNKRINSRIKNLDSLSPVAPFRIVNIGNSKPVLLLDFIRALEKALGKNAIMNMMPMQPGDVSITWANSALLKQLTGYVPDTDIQTGIEKFVEWYTKFYKVGRKD